LSELEAQLLRERRAAREYEKWEQEQAARVADQESHRARKENAGGVWDEDSQSWERAGRRGLEILPGDEIRPDHETLDDLPDEAALRRRYLFGDRVDEVSSEVKASDETTISDGPDERNAMKVEQFGSGSYMRFSIPAEDR
jgi:hypothetical protein